MSKLQQKTIAAISTPSGVGAVGMIRLTGKEAFEVAGRIFKPYDPRRSIEKLGGYTGALGKIYRLDGTPVDEAVAFVYRSPKSYTGEDVVELCCHGGPWAVRQVLRLCLEAGASPAGPGEFTRRAFLNGKMDLAQAEGVMDLVSARGEAALRAALSIREGSLSKQADAFCQALLEQSSHIAAWSDYPEEDLIPVDPAELQKALEDVLFELQTLLKKGEQGRLIREGAATAIIGKPNVGKSTLMNLLTGAERSIVTQIPGTTRDVVEETVTVGGILLNLMDTAGIRETEDAVEKIGVERSLSRLQSADLILAVFDGSDELSEQDVKLLELLRGKHCIGVVNKNDLPSRADRQKIQQALGKVVEISAYTGTGRDQLEQAILEALELHHIDTTAAMAMGERQMDCLRKAEQCIQEALEALEQGMTLDAVGVCLDAALDSLLALTGKRVTEAVVDQVFSRFCVGK
ncbi:MAG: tRNA uridine-5-carboxymethylaminomethyl(34) synthesis GTPase MnmE [Oscillospiraceae bacterium]